MHACWLIFRNITLMLLLAVILLGCSSGGTNQIPTLPGMDPGVTDQTAGDDPLGLTGGVPENEDGRESTSAGHALLGIFEVYVDPENQVFEIVPARVAGMHLNILKFMEQGPCFDCFKIEGVELSDHDSLLVGISLTNPFYLLDYTVFDTRGIMMFPGSQDFPLAGLKGPRFESGDGYVLNADGFTTLYNPKTIGSGFGGLQGYIKGNLATPDFPDCEINPFKRFNTDDPANIRNAFYGGDTVVVIYDIVLSTGPFIFGYAIDANWDFPINSPVVDPMTDFGPNANCPEPWRLDVTEDPIGGGLTNAGGATKLIIDVYDRDGTETYYAPVIECPGVSPDAVEATLVVEYADYATWEVIVANELHAEAGMYQCLIGVEDVTNGPPFEYLDLTAYQIITLEVTEATVIAKADFDPDEPEICEEILFFDDGSYDTTGGTIIGWKWDWDLDGVYDEFGYSVSHTFDVPDTYYVGYKATSDSGEFGEIVLVVKVHNALPTAEVFVEKTELMPDEEIVFDGTGSHDNDCEETEIVLWEWDWDNDGMFDETGQVVIHGWSEEGEYPINLRVTDDEGATDELDEPISIKVSTNVSPIAVADYNPKPAIVCEQSEFTGEGSYDPDGGEIEEFWWDWDNDGTYDESGELVSHSWDIAGEHPVMLKVIDDEGQEGELYTPLLVVVENIPPVAVAEAPEAVDNKWWINTPLNFDGSGSYDPDCEEEEIVNWEWDWENDGVYDDEGIAAVHSFELEQEYEIQLRVTDDEGGTDTLDEPLVIEFFIPDLPPVAIGLADPDHDIICELILFADDGSYDQDGGLIVKWEWDWENDGVFDEEGFELTHSWDEPGIYEINLRVTDEEDDTDELDEPLTVTMYNAYPIAMATVDKNEVFEYEEIQFDGSESYDLDCDGMEIVLYEWNFKGDGFYWADAGPAPVHAYAVYGTYYPMLRVTDDEGSTAELDEPLEITVNEYLEPVALFEANPNPQTVCEPVHFDASESYPQSGDSIVKYEWLFGQLPLVEGPAVTDHIWDTVGEKGVSVQVTDNNGFTSYAELAFIDIVNAQPTAIAEADKYTVMEDEPVNFDGGGSYDNDCDGLEITKFEWNFSGDGFIWQDVGPVPTHSYSVYGIYNVNFRVTDDEGGLDYIDAPLEILVTPDIVNPVAIADLEPDMQIKCEPVHFYDDGSYPQAGDSIVLYEWDWDNDGIYDEEGIDVFHTWYETGIFTIQFRVTDNLGYTGELDEPLNVNITSEYPTAEAEADKYEVDKDEIILFDATGSHDNDCDGMEIVLYEWNFRGDGFYWQDAGPTPMHSYSAYGTYYPQLRVTDDESEQDYLDWPLEIHVVDFTSPVAIADAMPNPATVCETIHFFDNGSYPQAGDYIEKHEWDWNNDGFYDEVGVETFHSFSVVGTRHIQFRVTDNLGYTDELDEPLAIIVENVLPTAVAEADNYNPSIGEIVFFDGSASTDNDCDGMEIVMYEWDFDGDGFGWVNAGPTPSYSYDLSGTYYPMLRVTDDEGGIDYLDAPLEIVVDEGDIPPVALAYAGPNPQKVCDVIHFIDDGSYDPDGGFIELYEWDWNNDGIYDAVGPSVDHSWDIPGTYYVQFRVTDDEGTSNTLESPIEIEIINAMPIAIADADKFTADIGEDIHFDGTASYDNDCDGMEIVLYEWYFDDGGLNWEDAGPTPIYSYDLPGTYEVLLRVTDDEGSTSLPSEPLVIIIE